MSQYSTTYVHAAVSIIGRSALMLISAVLVFSMQVSSLSGGAQRAWARRAPPAKTLDVAPPLTTLSLPALSLTERGILSEIREDPEPEEIIRNSHYWVSNEHNHQLWRSAVSELGGAYIGVGTDQNYLLAGWSRASLLILMDFDKQISYTHHLYMYLFSISATPHEFMKRWSKPYASDTRSKIAAHFKNVSQEIAEREARVKNLSEVRAANFVKRRARKLLRNYTRVYTLIRALVWRRLSRTVKKYTQLKIPTFITDQTEYDHIRSLIVGGRVIALRGDLVARRALIDVARALRKLNTPLNVLYLSNAEQYFGLPPTYRRNLIIQPWGKRSVALRTMAWKSLGYFDDDEAYHYNIQPGLNLVEWLKLSRTTKAGRIIFKGRVIKRRGFSVIEKLPKKTKRAPDIAPIPKDFDVAPNP